MSLPFPLSPRYWANLKLWFKQKISKEEFDLEARRLLTQDNGKKPSRVCVSVALMLVCQASEELLSAAHCFPDREIAVREIRIAGAPVALGGRCPELLGKFPLWPWH